MNIQKKFQNRYDGSKYGIIKTENQIRDLQLKLEHLKKERERLIEEIKRAGYTVINGDVTSDSNTVVINSTVP